MTETIVVSDISNEVNKKSLKYITLTFCYALFAFYFLINGRALFPSWTANETNSIFIYLIGVTAFLTVSIPLGTKINLKNQVKLIDIITNFSLAFPIFWIFFLLLKDAGIWFQGIHSIAPQLILPMVVFQVFIIGSSEELIFRGTIFPLLAKINVTIAIFLSSALFALFHFSAYGGNVMSVIVAFAIGIILVLLYIYFNIGTAIAFHSVYNLVIIGALII